MAIKKYEFKVWFSKKGLHKQLLEVEAKEDGVEYTTKEKDVYDIADPKQANMVKKSLLAEFERFLNIDNDSEV